MEKVGEASSAAKAAERGEERARFPHRCLHYPHNFDRSSSRRKGNVSAN